MELIGSLSNPQVGVELDRLAEAIRSLGPSLQGHQVELPPVQQERRGDILRATEAVLARHPEGLRMIEVRRLVAQELGRPVLVSTIKSSLARRPSFERISLGRYRLRDSDRGQDRGGPMA